MSDLQRLADSNFVWKYFIEITQVPRPTFQEEKIKHYLVDWADKNTFTYIFDGSDNMLITVPASDGLEDQDTIVLQAHRDMVCDKNADVKFDFMNESLNLEIKDGWLQAQGTTLGADNGIGVALAMSLATDPDIKHPKLEILITASEERGLVGAIGLSSDIITGKKVFNLDAEEWGAIYIGCAGSLISKCSKNIIKHNVSLVNTKILNITIDGLCGGHSGADIHHNYINSSKLSAFCLNDLQKEINFEIVDIDSGNLPNTIPREVKFSIALSSVVVQKAKDILNKRINKYKQDYAKTELNLDITIVESDLNKKTQVYNQNLTIDMIKLLVALPSGVMEMSDEIEGMVRTSSNLASIKEQDNKIVITNYSRSDNGTGLYMAEQMISNIASLAHFNIETGDISPWWSPNKDTPLLNKTIKAYEDFNGDTPKITSIHAGLECGLLKSKYIDIDVVSIGPNIRGAHSPSERVEIDTVNKLYEVMKLIIK